MIEVTGVDGRRRIARVGERLVLAASLVESVAAEAGITAQRTVGRACRAGRSPAPSLRHPLHGQGYDFAVPLLAGDFVSAEDGTGLVHIAPSHGADDFELGAKHGLEVPDAVGEDGHYTDAVPLFAGIARVQGGRAGDRRAARARRAAGARQAGAQLPAFLAVEGAADLPRHAAVVHPDGRRRTRLREKALRAIDGDPLGAARRAKPHPRHGREPARLVHLAPARLGRADRGVRAQGQRRAAARSPRWSSASPRRSSSDGADAWYTRDPRAVPRPRARPGRLRAGHGHRRCLVRLRLDPRHRAGAARRSCNGRPRSISKAPTSTAAGSIRRC